MRLLISLTLLLCSVPALADGNAEARALYNSATSAYALGHYAEAATDYEKAFALKPDPALLYNAAQAHRSAGNKERALLLYKNYLRVFGDQAANAEEVRRLIANLQLAIDNDAKTAAAPPVAPQPLAPSATPSRTPAPSLSVTAPASQPTPVYRKAWFWGVMGGVAAVVVAGVVVGAVLGGSHTPSPTLGTVAGN